MSKIHPVSSGVKSKKFKSESTAEILSALSKLRFGNAKELDPRIFKILKKAAKK